MLFDTVKHFCALNGTSGREEKVREYIISQLDEKCSFHVDNMGNLIAFKKGKKEPKNKVMLCAHMDEVGFIITGINSDGSLNFDSVGGVDKKVVCGRTLVVDGKKTIYGVVGLKPVHLADNPNKVPDISSMSVDIGAKSKEEAEEYVTVGDVAYFASIQSEFGTNKFCSKALDDRFGCAIMLDMINSELDFDMYFAFLVQEEVGLRGSPAAAYQIQPDYAIVLEATTASDIAGVSGTDRVCVLGEGAVVSFMDRSTVYDRELFKSAFSLAKENNIVIQTKTVVAGGNDAGSIHKANAGIKTITISLPCRYIHSGTSVADKSDMQACRNLAKLLAKEYANA